MSDPGASARAREIVEGLPSDPADREAYLIEQCGDDSRLRTLVEHYLRVTEHLEQPFEGLLRAAAAGVTGAAPPSSHPQLGSLVGPYRVRELIGVGGMGVAYLADRADGEFEQEVVLKVGRRAYDQQVHRMLERERNVLASLDHPHIAHLLNGGTTPHGRPYLAIDYVRGVPLTEYCDAQRLDVRKRLTLFDDAAAAVQHAHRSLVIHRDLKPANILVSDEGVVKLIDFGIAKVLSAAEVPDPDREEARAFTAAYAAPEQVRGDVITTATDVYGLGAVLYELLTGCRPHARDRTAARPGAPGAPSEIAMGVGHVVGSAPAEGGAEARAQARGTSPRGLQKVLRGDLDGIVSKALAIEPGRRYESVEALRDDLRRWMRGRPISLYRHRAAYRAGKLLRRHAAVFTAATIGLAILVGGVASTLWQARRTAAEAERAEQVTSFVLSLFESTDPDRAGSSQLSAAELLRRSIPRLDAELADQPELQTEVLMVVADAFERLGYYSEALPLVERAVEQRRAQAGSDDPEVAAGLRRAGYLYIREQDLDRAEPLLIEAIEIERAAYGERNAAFATTQDNLAELRRLQGRVGEADSLASASLETRRALLGPDHLDIGWSLNNLGVIRRTLGQYDDAEALFRESLEMKRRLFSPTHSEVVLGVNNLANLLRLRGRTDEAEALYRETETTLAEVFGEAHPSTITVRNNLAAVLFQNGSLTESEDMFRRVLGAWEARGEMDHPDAVGTLNNLSTVLRAQGKAEEAVRSAQSAVDGWTAHYGESHERVGIAVTNLGLALYSAGRTLEAQGALEQAFPIALATPLQSPLRPHLAGGLTAIHAAEGRCADAPGLVAELLTGDATAVTADFPQAVLTQGGCAPPAN